MNISNLNYLLISEWLETVTGISNENTTSCSCLSVLLGDLLIIAPLGLFHDGRVRLFQLLHLLLQRDQRRINLLAHHGQVLDHALQFGDDLRLGLLEEDAVD